VINWVNEAWTTLSKETIVNGFVKAKWMEDPRPSSSVNQLVEQLLGLTVSVDLSKDMEEEKIISEDDSDSDDEEEVAAERSETEEEEYDAIDADASQYNYEEEDSDDDSDLEDE
jgi:hypothetical protein